MDNEDLNDMFSDIRDYHQRLYNVMSKLRSDPCMNIPKVGDTVIVAAGPLGMGHEWIRLEAQVLHVANNSYKIRIFNRPQFIYPEGYQDMWIDPVLVLDIISQEQSGEGNP